MSGFGRFVLPLAREGVVAGLREAPRWVLAPVPLFALQPVLLRIVRGVAHRHPDIFDRLAEHTTKRFLIDPVNLPFVFVLKPDRRFPTLRACRRGEEGVCEARISGTFLTLLDLLDRRLDGDALFFSRDLKVEGDTEAVVVLRNALDDLNDSVVEDIVRELGVFSAPVRGSLALLRRLREKAEQARGRDGSPAPEERDDASGFDTRSSVPGSLAEA